jgi:hypothetical protein
MIARRTHRIPGRTPIRIDVGDRVEVGERDTEWPEFVFVTTDAGSGWVPARYLSSDSGKAVVEVAYDTTELEVSPGDALTVLRRDDRSGWWWCRNPDGGEGWVPIAVFE